jgi:hypothetical protein
MWEEGTVRDELLDTLYKKGPLRYSELVNLLGRPDKTVYINLNNLESADYIKKNDAGQWDITQKGKEVLQFNWAFNSLKTIGFQQVDWAPGILGYRMLKMWDRIKKEHGEDAARKYDDTVNQAASDSLRFLQTSDLEVKFEQYMKLQNLLGEIMKINPSLEKFVLVLVFDPREALQRKIDLHSQGWNYSKEEFNMMLQEIRALWTKKAWIEKITWDRL